MTSTALIPTPTPTVEVGGVYEVGRFFWTQENKCIGFADDARHGHGLSFGGSVAAGDCVEVLGIEGDEAVVKVLKERLPYGAPCPHGMIFLLPISQILSWPDLVSRRREHAGKMSGLAHKYRARRTV